MNDKTRTTRLRIDGLNYDPSKIDPTDNHNGLPIVTIGREYDVIPWTDDFQNGNESLGTPESGWECPIIRDDAGRKRSVGFRDGSGGVVGPIIAFGVRWSRVAP